MGLPNSRENGSHIGIVAYAVSNDNHSGPTIGCQLNSTPGDINRFRGGLRYDYDDVGLSRLETQEGPHPGFEITDNDSVVLFKLTEQGLRRDAATPAAGIRLVDPRGEHEPHTVGCVATEALNETCSGLLMLGFSALESLANGDQQVRLLRPYAERDPQHRIGVGIEGEDSVAGTR